MSLLTAIATAGQTAANIVQGIQQYRRQKELMDKAHNQAIERWNLENAYNAPSAVMQRLKDAGLNPNLVYGNAGVGTAGSINSSSTPDAYASNAFNGVPSMIQAMQQSQLTDSQIDLNRSIAEKNRSEVGRNNVLNVNDTARLQIDTKNIESLIRRRDKENQLSDMEIRNLAQTIAESCSRISLNRSMLHYYENNAKLVKLNIDHYEERFKKEMNEILARTGYYNEAAKEQATKAVANIYHLQEETELLISQRNLNDASAREIMQRVHLNAYDEVWALNKALSLGVSRDDIDKGIDAFYNNRTFVDKTTGHLQILMDFYQSLVGGFLEPFKGIFSYSGGSFHSTSVNTTTVNKGN